MSPPRDIQALADVNPGDETRGVVLAAYRETAPAGWNNYGDADPAEHGGVWARWLGAVDGSDGRDAWEVVQTDRSADMGFTDTSPDDMGDQYVRRSVVRFVDVVTESARWSDEILPEIRAASHAHAAPLGAVVDGDLTRRVAHYATSPNHPERESQRVNAPTYGAVLARFGVDPDA